MLVVFVVEQQGQAANTANINFESYDVCCAGQRLQRDHFTSACLAKVLTWTVRWGMTRINHSAAWPTAEAAMSNVKLDACYVCNVQHREMSGGGVEFPDARTRTRGTLASNAKLQYQIAPAPQHAGRSQRCAVSCTVNSSCVADLPGAMTPPRTRAEFPKRPS
jgi:hypothetical protein